MIVCTPEIKQKQPQDRKTIFETLSLPVAKILSPVARQAPTKSKNLLMGLLSPFFPAPFPTVSPRFPPISPPPFPPIHPSLLPPPPPFFQFSSGFSMENGPLRRIRGNGPLKRDNAPLRPCLADEQTGETGQVNLDHLTGQFRGHFRGRLRGMFRGTFRGSPGRAENREINPRGSCHGRSRGRSRGPVGPLVDPLVDPLVGRGSLSPALCVAQWCWLVFSVCCLLWAVCRHTPRLSWWKTASPKIPITVRCAMVTYLIQKHFSRYLQLRL